MKFLVTKKSNSSDKEKPCDDKRLTFEKYDKIETWECTEEEFNRKFSKKWGGLWKSKGTNHKICNNGKSIQRTLPNAFEGWFIELYTLEELMEFVISIEYGIVSLDKKSLNGEINVIEIDDTYNKK